MSVSTFSIAHLVAVVISGEWSSNRRTEAFAPEILRAAVDALQPFPPRSFTTQEPKPRSVSSVSIPP